ncbi:MAG: MBOAT family O-acyltransferase [Flavobacteriia bacterium]|jgi:D-alanyl-lipoteichoic acid acyltransferase DltB (MBOAT superfamily)
MERIYEIFSFAATDRMVFNRLDFWLFFLAFMVVFSALHKQQLVRSIFFTIVSLFLYFKTSGLFVVLLGGSIIVNFFLGKWVFKTEKESGKKWIIAVAAIFNLFFLAFFKYAYFFTDSYNQLFQTKYEIVNWFAQMGNGFFGTGFFETKILLPAGVSFFTFQSISYVVDIKRKEIEPVKNIFDYGFYVTFFPHVIMGPIVRARDFIPQIYQPFSLNKDQFSSSVILIVKGLIKKIILADYIAVHFIDKIVDSPEAYPGFVSVLAMWGYSLQIYGDFSGYTDIAIGISRLMGFELLPNFNSPYKANSVADFWRRWHKSLGSWLRDYLYIPLGGNKSGGWGTYMATTVIFIFLFFILQWYELIYVYSILMGIYLIGVLISPSFKRYVHRDLNLLITMIVGGLWHGASENFIIWGAMNGIALVIYNYWKKISPYENKSWWIVHFWKIFLTFNFITFTRIWFRLDEEGEPMAMLNHIWNHFDFQWATFVKVLETYQSVFWIILFGFIFHWLPERTKKWYESLFAKFPMPLQAITVAVIVILIYQAVSDTFKPFVYFQF